MPFSYSYFSATAILLMMAVIAVGELVKYFRKHYQH